MTELALAVDLGGTKIEAALVDSGGAVLPGSRARRPTGARLTPDLLQATLIQVVRQSVRNAPRPVQAIGVGSAGPVDRAAGTIFPVNLPGVSGFALRDAVAEAARWAELGDVDVRLGHDGGCLALAESWVGATQGAAASMSIVVSTGIGGGLVLDGRWVTGASGNAGHLGQTRVDGALMLEQIASGPASVAWAREQGWDGDSGEQLGKAAASGDPVARAAIERSARAVGQALADAAVLIDLDVIAIGGGFAQVSDDYVDLVAAALREAATLPYAAAVRVVPSGLAGDGPVIGAAALVLHPGV
ncbi:ROK family protein [Microbacterium kribbense]|uniref:ROK family protein n=1 Tax=Microbacterium kribbense TaxID=433645 RepID=UPI0031E31EDF